MQPVNSEIVANRFITLASEKGTCLTNMQVQKLVFIAHGYMLGVFATPLVADEAKAFQWGPVLPALYQKLRVYGRGCVFPTAAVETAPLDAKQISIIQAVWKNYGHKTGAQLSDLTHRPGTPWSEVWARHPFGHISNDLIANHYKKLVSPAGG